VGVVAKTRLARGRGDEARLPAEAERLLELLLAEIREPADPQKLFEEFPPVQDCIEEARRFLKAKDRAVRREGFVKNERLWFNKYGWFMARVLTLFGLISFAFYFASRGAAVDFLTAFLLGAGGYYVLLSTLSNLRYRDGSRKRRRLLEAEAGKYQRQIAQVGSDLLKRYGVSPDLYPIKEPRLPAGLEQREEGYYLVVS